MKSLKSRILRALVAMSLCLLAVPTFQSAEAHIREVPERAELAMPRTAEPRPLEARLVDSTTAADAGVSPEVLNLALRAISCATTTGAIDAPPTLTLIDYSRPS